MLADPAAERRMLLASMAGSAVLGLLAVVWGVLSGSRVILLDGAYVLVGIVLAWASLRAAGAAQAGASARFPFGKESFTPMVIGLQGAALAATLVLAAVDAVTTLRHGGSSATPASVLAYGVATAVVGAVVAWLLPRGAAGSELVAVEAVQWRAGTTLSAVMALGAGAALVVSRFVGDGFVHYVDPALVLVAVAVLAPTPVRLLRDAVLELVEAAPPEPLARALREAAQQVADAEGLDTPLVRATKLGGKVYLEVDFVVTAGRWDVADEDRVRRAVLDAVAPLGYDVWANVELTTDPDLIA